MKIRDTKSENLSYKNRNGGEFLVSKDYDGKTLISDGLYTLIKNGVEANSSNSIELSGSEYINISEECSIILPQLTELQGDIPSKSYAQFLMKIKDSSVNKTAVHLVDPLNRVIVSNQSTSSYQGSISAHALGLSQAWKVVMARVFKRPDGTELLHLEV